MVHSHPQRSLQSLCSHPLVRNEEPKRSRSPVLSSATSSTSNSGAPLHAAAHHDARYPFCKAEPVATSISWNGPRFPP